MAKMGRPLKEIDQIQFEKLCGMMCTLTDIAGFFDCSEDTIERWCKRTYGETFAETFKKRSSMGKISLRKYQFELAKKNAAMAIFLGKQYLGQKDNYEFEDKDALNKLDSILTEIKDGASKSEAERIHTESE